MKFSKGIPTVSAKKLIVVDWGFVIHNIFARFAESPYIKFSDYRETGHKGDERHFTTHF